VARLNEKPMSAKDNSNEVLTFAWEPLSVIAR